MKKSEIDNELFDLKIVTIGDYTVELDLTHHQFLTFKSEYTELIE